MTGETAGVSVGSILGAAIIAIVVITILFFSYRSVNKQTMLVSYSHTFYTDTGKEGELSKQQIQCTETLFT